MRTKNRDSGEIEHQTETISRFRANDFTIDISQDWQDATVYTIAGPIEDEMQHNVVINVGRDVDIDSVEDLADLQIESLEMQLQGYRILKRGAVTLNNGHEAYEAIFRWEPTEVNRLYQRQIYVLAGKTAYTLTSTFSKKTRKTRGPEVDRILMSFEPEMADE